MTWSLLGAFVGGGAGYLATSLTWRWFHRRRQRKAARAAATALKEVFDRLVGPPDPSCDCPGCKGRRAAMEKRN